MRFLIITILIFWSSIVAANGVSGKVDIVLKGDKEKADLDSTLVYLEPNGGKAEIPSAEVKKVYTVTMKNKQFAPQAIVIPVGATVDFPNDDAIYHNIFSVSKPNQFDLGLYKSGASESKTFSAPGEVKIFCNVHPQMTGTIMVVQSPYYTMTDKDGNFSFSDVTPGLYVINAFSEEGQTSQKIDIRQNSIKVMLTIDGKNYKKLPHKNKFGKDYNTDENEKY
jgi:plastocyanin